MIFTKVDDLTAQKVDVIVNASNGIGVMGKGTAGAIRRVGGVDIEDEAKIYCKTFEPQPGTTFMTKAGQLQANKVFHAVTMKLPGTSYRQSPERGLKIVRNCLNSLFDLFALYNYKSIAVPALATGVGGLDVADVAKIFVDVIVERGYHASDKKIYIIDINDVFIESCEIELARALE